MRPKRRVKGSAPFLFEKTFDANHHLMRIPSTPSISLLRSTRPISRPLTSPQDYTTTDGCCTIHARANSSHYVLPIRPPQCRPALRAPNLLHHTPCVAREDEHHRSSRRRTRSRQYIHWPRACSLRGWCEHWSRGEQEDQLVQGHEL